MLYNEKKHMFWLYKKVGEFLKDAVYAANDGIITTFAVVAGVVGASLDPVIILVLGFANLFADGISMASGSYLGTKSEEDQCTQERGRNLKVLRENRELYKERVSKFLRNKGYGEIKVTELSQLILENEQFALDFMLHEDRGLCQQVENRAFKGAAVTFVSFLIAGLVPLVPYIFFSNGANTFIYAVLFTGVALFVVGAARSAFIEKSWIVAGVEMFSVGGVAAAIAYGIGYMVSVIVVR
ncbi:MAG: hypothetical protein A3B96_01605 [Candidatus Spechtbacteria bacterium RIFCSPHIGHO2_02_FULL_43_15b]|uniref:GMP synthase n=1 Tax=Candidatus Spechtbacteria bacterium RIFCSPHIGHO2_01_FULL_43_30 TaxID=1802158 RepID=A0A1G2H6C0_9BACT|nr:MAG: hypothetical protein A2827_01305 [Candidatus Spechtbacteria bacterium RIFCSPHIGHO2_01_FULL_43_30]OGZ60455.1 MAG: hypothetical protein A3B96_01605 [Candidatus Spechtbacteria bacterium RIFCSPHIGHO2_02_FULL_43_15b]